MSLFLLVGLAYGSYLIVAQPLLFDVFAKPDSFSFFPQSSARNAIDCTALLCAVRHSLATRLEAFTLYL